MAKTCFSTTPSKSPTSALSTEEDGICTIRSAATSGVTFEVETTIPTEHGTFQFRAYRDLVSGSEHLAVVSGTPTDGCFVRVHSECLTGEVFESQKCDCGPQLDSALDTINQYGGVVIYMRGHEGRGIGLANKLKAYRLQEAGLDTLDANLALGLPADDRDYSAAAAILHNLRLRAVRLLTNNPDKIGQLTAHGITVLERVPLTAGAHPANSTYLRTKRDRMGHLLQHAH
jgi:3,4-dihydroxy 2-butanone 4-phosphate synthase/GTP cyclohydrolase II